MAGNSNGRCLIWGYRVGEVLAGVEGDGAELTPLEELAGMM